MTLLISICLVIAITRAYQNNRPAPMEPSHDVDPFIRSVPKGHKPHLVGAPCHYCKAFKSVRKPQP